MNLSSSYTFDAPCQRVWDLLHDPIAIADCLPGCEAFEPTGPYTYRAVLIVGVAAISGRYEGTVTMTNRQEPSSYRLVVDGRGRTGFVKGEADLMLMPPKSDEERTKVTVEGRVQVGGVIARVGQRLLSSVSKTMMDRFFDCLAGKVGGDSPDPGPR